MHDPPFLNPNCEVSMLFHMRSVVRCKKTTSMIFLTTDYIAMGLRLSRVFPFVESFITSINLAKLRWLGYFSSPL